MATHSSILGKSHDQRSLAGYSPWGKKSQIQLSDSVQFSSVAQSCPTLCNPMDCIARQAPLSMGFFRQEYWSGLPCPPTGDLSDSGIKPASLTSPALAGMFFVVVQSLSQKIKICLCDPKDCNTPGFLSFTISQSLLKLMSIELMMLSNHLILC